MSDPVFPPLEPDRISEDVAALAGLIATGVEIDGQAQVATSTWVIYGHTTYDGEIIVGEYGDAAEAAAVLRATPRPGPDDAGPIP